MSDFRAKMHQIRFRLGSLKCSPRPLAGLKGPTFKGREGGEVNGEREGKEGVRERGGRGKGKAFPCSDFTI